MYAEYRRLCRSNEPQPVGIHVFQALDRIIVNLATPRGIYRGAAHLDGVRIAARAAAQVPLEIMALPRIGGPRGLGWPVVRAVLEEELAPLPYVEFWSLPEADCGH